MGGAITANLSSGTLGLWEFSAKITPDDAHEHGVSDPDAGNINPYHSFVFFGSSVAIDGSTMVVGTAVDDCDLATWAYVFERTEGEGWEQVAKLTPSDGQFAGTHFEDPCSAFGYDVAVDDDAGIIVVGNPGFEEGDGSATGSAYVFERTSEGAWAEVDRLRHPHPSGAEDSWFGSAVAVEDGLLLVGAPFDSRVDHLSGAAFLYSRGTSGWELDREFTGEGHRSFLGWSVASSGDRAMVSEPGRSSVSVLGRSVGSWTVVDQLVPPSAPDVGGVADYHFFGRSIDIDDRRVVVGASSWPTYQLVLDAHGTGSGTAYAYELSDGEWGFESQLIPPDSHPDMAFGWSVGVSGEGAVIGARDAVQGGEGPMGAAYVFEDQGPQWAFVAKLRAPDTGPDDWFGNSVSITGDTVAVGAPFDDNRLDNYPYPMSDDGDLPPCLSVLGERIVRGCDHGEEAGSVYVFEQGVSAAVAPNVTVPSKGPG